jgi:hypothetical protein
VGVAGPLGAQAAPKFRHRSALASGRVHHEGLRARPTSTVDPAAFPARRCAAPRTGWIGLCTIDSSGFVGPSTAASRWHRPPATVIGGTSRRNRTVSRARDHDAGRVPRAVTARVSSSPGLPARADSASLEAPRSRGGLSTLADREVSPPDVRARPPRRRALLPTSRRVLENGGAIPSPYTRYACSTPESVSLSLLHARRTRVGCLRARDVRPGGRKLPFHPSTLADEDGRFSTPIPPRRRPT